MEQARKEKVQGPDLVEATVRKQSLQQGSHVEEGDLVGEEVLGEGLLQETRTSKKI
jgi:hypothetical protein